MEFQAAATPKDGSHPLELALRAAGITQEELSERIAKLRLRRPDGSPLTLAQSSISNTCRWKRRLSPEVAEAIVLALRDRVTVDKAALVFAKRPKSATKTRGRKRAA